MNTYLSDILNSAIPALFFWGILLISMGRDRSRYRNCSLLMIAILFTLPVLTRIAGPYRRTAALVILILLVVAILLVPMFLIANGVIMMRNEGRSLKNLLSLFLGIGIELGEICLLLFVLGFAYAVNTDQSSFLMIGRLPELYLFVTGSAIYFSLSFLAFMLYTLFLEIVPGRRNFDYIIILGAGLINGNKISKLLSDRLDKAIAIYKRSKIPPILIPSGGRGADEELAEADAMAAYLREHSIPEEHILPENESRNTMENLINSKKLIEERSEQASSALVTSNYHVYRALRHCRKLGFTCTGIGAHVAAYYWPSALIREYIAIHSKGKQLYLLMGGWLLLVVIPLLWFLW